MTTEQSPLLRNIMLAAIAIALGGGMAFTLMPKETPPANPTASASSEAAPAEWEGQSVPNFTLPALDGKKINLESYKGKVVFLNFWATWCEPCKEEMPSMQKLYTHLKGKPFEMLAVSMDAGDNKAVTKFLGNTSVPLTFPILRDPDQATAKGLFKTTGVPETFVIGPDGKVIKHIIGGFEWDQPQILKYFDDLMAKI
jgi:peroxiredoxin